MTKTITLLIISLLGNVVFGQANLSLFKRSDECANRDYTASTEDKANHAIMDRLLPKSEYPHLLNSIQVRACPGLNNCITRLLKPGSKTVLILYDTAFIEKRKKSAAQADNSGLTYKGETRDWVTIGIFAHELGHILCRHVDDSVQTDPHQSELQADEYIGILLRKMGATLQQAQSCMIGSKISDEGDHPGRDKRFRAIERGYYGLYLQKAIQVFHAGDSALAYKILINKDLELNAEGYLCLAELQEKGRGGAVRDTFDAIENYEKAIRADSNCCLAYAGWTRLTQEQNTVFQMQVKAALRNCPKALVYVGYHLESIGKNLEAFKAYQKAAHQNEPQAWHNLAYLYEIGKGVPQDAAKTLDCYKKAAELGWKPSREVLRNRGIFIE